MTGAGAQRPAANRVGRVRRRTLGRRRDRETFARHRAGHRAGDRAGRRRRRRAGRRRGCRLAAGVRASGGRCAPRERGGLLRLVAAVIREHLTSWPTWRRGRSASRAATPCGSTSPSAHAGCDYYAGLPTRCTAGSSTGARSRPAAIYEPYGVVAAILPFNWPPIHFTKKSAPALAAGQHSDHQAGRAGAADGAASRRACQRGPAAGRAQRGARAGRRACAVRHPRVERITFTGATATGRRVCAAPPRI